MREIKFRVWLRRQGNNDKEYFIMEDVDFYFFEEWGYRTSGEVEEAGHKLMQYTGLKDKNGEGIYEGDILQDTGYGAEGALPGVVMFGDWDNGQEGDENDRGIGWFTEDSSGYRRSLLDFVLFDNEIRVIGNIYENPELLSNTQPY